MNARAGSMRGLATRLGSTLAAGLLSAAAALPAQAAAVYSDTGTAAPPPRAEAR